MSEKKEDEFENDFAQVSKESKNSGFFSELLDFTGSGGRWWLLPIIIVMLLLGALLLLSATGAAPFIYSIF